MAQPVNALLWPLGFDLATCGILFYSPLEIATYDCDTVEDVNYKNETRLSKGMSSRYYRVSREEQKKKKEKKVLTRREYKEKNEKHGKL